MVTWFLCVDSDMVIYILSMDNEHGFECKRESKRVCISIMKMNKLDVSQFFLFHYNFFTFDCLIHKNQLVIFLYREKRISFQSLTIKEGYKNQSICFYILQQ